METTTIASIHSNTDEHLRFRLTLLVCVAILLGIVSATLYEVHGYTLAQKSFYAICLCGAFLPNYLMAGFYRLKTNHVKMASFMLLAPCLLASLYDWCLRACGASLH
jgi:hypothetical protein